MSAAFDPLSPEKMYMATTSATSSPPVQWPTHSCTMSIMRRAMPVTSMSVPATMKNGTANRTKLVTPYCSAEGTVAIGASPVTTKYSRPASARMPPIGIPVMKPMTSAGTIGMNGSMSIRSSNHAQRKANAATAINAPTPMPMMTARLSSTLSFSIENRQNRISPSPSHIATKPELMPSTWSVCVSCPAKNDG